MRRLGWLLFVAVIVLGLLAGVAVGGRPIAPVDLVLSEPDTVVITLAVAVVDSPQARDAAVRLRSEGWQQVEVRKARSVDDGTRIYAASQAMDAAMQVAATLGIEGVNPEQFPVLAVVEGRAGDVVVVLGDDYRN